MKQTTKSKIGIYSLSLLSMVALGITPSIDLIATDLGVDATTVQQLTAVPNLMSLVSALVFSAFANRMPRKIPAVLAPVLILIGGLVPVFVDGGFTLLLVCSAILGLGAGFVNNTTNTLITDLLPPEEQGRAMSQNVIFVNLGSIIMTSVGGVLASGGWRQNYLVYLVALPVLILLITCIPYEKVAAPGHSDDASEAEQASGEKRSGVLKGMGVAVICFLIMACTNMCFSAFANNASLLLGDWMDAGQVSSWAGIVVAVGTIGGIVAGLTIDYLKPLKRVMLVFGSVLMCVGMVLLARASSLPLTMVAAFLIGYAMAVANAELPYLISIGTDPAYMANAMGLFSAGTALGGAISPTVLNFLSGLFFGGSTVGCCYIAAIVSGAIAIVLLATRFQSGLMDRAGAAA